MTLRFIDKYEIVTTLGRGSMGVVYKAKDPEIGRLVAIKTLKSVFMGDDAAGNEALQRFRQESRSAGKLHHPNIVTIFEAGRTDNGSPYIVMEYIEGKSLEANIAENGPLDPLAALHYLSQISSAIDYAHSQSVIHRDIKPSNIIVDAHHRPYLLDFGVAKLSDTSLTPAGTVVGTPSYMSPEQIRGSQLDGRTDLFSLAVVTFEAFTGSRPFPGTDFTSVVGNIIHKEPMTFAEVSSQLPAELERVLRKALSKERDQRFGSALEFLDACARSFGVIIDGTGLAGGYSPGLKIPDVAARELAQRTRAATVVGSFQPSEVGLSAASPEPAEGATVAVAAPTAAQLNDSIAQARAQAEIMTDVPTSVHQRPSYTNGTSGSGGAAAEPQQVSEAPRTEPPKRQVKEARDTGPSWTRPVIGLLTIMLAGLAALVVKPHWLDEIRGKLTFSTGGAEEESSSGEDADSEASSEQVVSPKPEEKSERVEPTPAAVVKVQPTPIPVEQPAGPRWTKPAVSPGGFSESSVGSLKDAEIGWLLSRENTDVDSLRLAINEAAKRSSEDLTIALSETSKNPDFKIRVDVLKAFSKAPQHSKRKAAIAAIENNLKDTEFIVRGFAVKIYAAVRGPDALPVLEAMAKDEKNAVVVKVLNDTLTQLKGSASGAAR